MDEHLMLTMILIAVALIASCAISLLVLVGLPHDYLCASRPIPAQVARDLLDTTVLVLRNLLGSALIVVGAILAIPLVPGPGLLIAAAGMLLLDFPGKARMLHKLLNKPTVLRPINRLRRAFARAPLLVD
jgi:hypothetical protein